MIEDYEYVSADLVGLGAAGGGGFRVERSPAAITFALSELPSLETLLHPLLTVPISVMARWRGDTTLHAGAFEADGDAWAILGTREAGKSTMLAALAERGHPVVADDLLTIAADLTVWAGPHCVDLRPDVAARFPSRLVGTVGGRERHRLRTPAGSPRLPLGGILMLEWHDRSAVEVTPLEAGERLTLLYEQEYIALLGAIEPARLLELMTIPAWRVARPRDWQATDDVVEQLLSLTRTGPAPPATPPAGR